jgi:hypothetical protein
MSHKDFNQKIYSNPPDYPIPDEFSHLEFDPLYISPLGSGDRTVASGMLLASGESHFFDFSQHPDSNSGSGINAIYPSPELSSGMIFLTSPSDASYGVLVDSESQSGIFTPSGLKINFSNAKAVGVQKDPEIKRIVSFNSYIHYISKEE